MEIKLCCLTGQKLSEKDIEPIVSTTFVYTTKTCGKIQVTHPAYTELTNGNGDEDQFPYTLLRGICRNASENGEDSPLFTSEFIREGYKQLQLPKTFDEKKYRFLKYLYLKGGNENVSRDLNSTQDYPLAYSEPDEFMRIVEDLENENYISIRRTHNLGSRLLNKLYMGVTLTRLGKEEVEKELPKMPMIGLVDQEITTGDPTIDSQINHAKALFFKEYASLNDKRSACESLSYVLEPLRDDLSTFFSNSDVSDFFQIVNRFDIRHNKESTIALNHEEQLEWVFYTLLNTISTYTKLKNKIQS